MGFFRTRKDIFIQEGVSMEYQGIIITGASGAGKSSIAQKLCEQYKIFQIVQAVTTRKPREDDYHRQYQYISKVEFEKLDEDNRLLIKSEYRGKYYGITHEALQEVIGNSKIPLLILTPKSVVELKIKKNLEDYTSFIVFLDAPDEILDTRLNSRGENINETVIQQRKEDRGYLERLLKTNPTDYVYSIKNTDIEKTLELIWSLWNHRKTGGILSEKLIRLMIECDMLLENANLDNIQGASYDLRLGDKYFQKGEIKTLDEQNPFVVMEPGDYVLISSKEIANLPKDIAGRFDLTVSLFCKGVILSNGPQVDPGFHGGLFCLLFNTANNKVQLKHGEHYATIEFVKLVEPTVPYMGKYQNKLKMKDYLPEMVEASAINKLMEDVENLKKEKWWIKILPLVVSILALILAIAALIGMR